MRSESMDFFPSLSKEISLRTYQFAVEAGAVGSTVGRRQRTALDAGCKVDRRRRLGLAVGALVRHQQVELRTRHHGALAERMLVHQVLGDDGIQRHYVGRRRIAVAGRHHRRLPTVHLLQRRRRLKAFEAVGSTPARRQIHSDGSRRRRRRGHRWSFAGRRRSGLDGGKMEKMNKIHNHNPFFLDHTRYRGNKLVFSFSFIMSEIR